MVQINSFVSEAGLITPIQVELTLWPGLPIIHFLGLPDQQIRESAIRIKSALRAQGFEFPKAKQILVNLRPNHLKKTSKGVELAVAVAYLLETGQIPRSAEASSVDFFVYGELSLGGRILTPDDLSSVIQKYSSASIVTGGDRPAVASFQKLACLKDLGGLRSSIQFVKVEQNKKLQRPAMPDFKWDQFEAEVLSVAASGEHSLFLAGPSGSGKTSLAAAIQSLLPEPPESISRVLLLQDSPTSSWRPLVRPHPRIPLRALLGGSIGLEAGELSRAHGGVLLLDEYLEFQPEVIEALRQPFEEGLIRVARSGKNREIPAQCMFVATSNLCPCGNWTPEKGPVARCRFSLKRCRSYSERLSGPMLDRFQMVELVAGPSHPRSISMSMILARVQAATDFRRKRREQELPNAWAAISQVEAGTSPFLRRELLPKFWGSTRRELATLRVARSLADLELSPAIESSHLKRALEWTYLNFSRLSRWD